MEKEYRLYKNLQIINWMLWLCLGSVLIGWVTLFYNGTPTKVLGWAAHIGLDGVLKELSYVVRSLVDAIFSQ